MSKTRTIGWTTLMLVLLAATSRAEDAVAKKKEKDGPTYFMCVFSYDSVPRRAKGAHTFATFIRSEGESFEAHTISWFPQTNAVRVVRRFAETGVNLTLEKTLENARNEGADVCEWGPYQIRPELYEKALQQIKLLKSGRVAYKAIDGNGRPNVLNCIHAVSDIDADRGQLRTGTSFGAEASALVVEHLTPWIIKPEKKHAWINDKLGLKKGAIKQR